MKFIARIRNLTLALVLGSAASLAFAQSEPDRPRPERPMRPERPPQPDRVQPSRRAAGPMVEGLSPEQRRALRETFLNVREKSRELMERMREARQRLQNAAWEERPNREVIRDRAMELARLEVELAMVRARAVADIRPKLSRGQIEQIRRLQGQFGEEMRERLQSQAGRPFPDRGRAQEQFRRDDQRDDRSRERGDRGPDERRPNREEMRDRPRPEGRDQDVPERRSAPPRRPDSPPGDGEPR